MTETPGDSLAVLLHGVGSSGRDLAPLADALRAFLPRTHFVAPDAPNRFDRAPGRQWFGVVGVNEENRPQRIEAARGGFDRVLTAQLDRFGLSGRTESRGAGRLLPGRDHGARRARHGTLADRRRRRLFRPAGFAGSVGAGRRRTGVADPRGRRSGHSQRGDEAGGGKAPRSGRRRRRPRSAGPGPWNLARGRRHGRGISRRTPRRLRGDAIDGTGLFARRWLRLGGPDAGTSADFSDRRDRSCPT